MTGNFIELVRLATTPQPSLDAMVRKAAYTADPRLVITIVPLADSARHDIRNERDAMLVLQVLSALALVLAATGLFAVMAYAVAQRQREFGVRMALGAAPGDLLELVLRRGLVLAALGVIIGLGAAWGLTRFLRTILYETSPHDPITYAGVAVVLLGVAALACWLPARRAARVNPVDALRAE
jgi:putative ABC transport system permease protein